MENPANAVNGTVQYVRLGRIESSKNPRKYFDEKKMLELENSVAEHGVIQPVLLRIPEEDGGSYQLIAGGRRYRAALKVLGEMYQIPALCKRMTDAEATRLALIENIQRDDMSPTEEAEAAAEVLGQCDADRAEAARVLGWPLQKLEKRLALMNCSASVRDALTERKILLGHAELLATAPKEKQDVVLKKLLEAPALIPVPQFKASLEQASKELASAIFLKDDCAGCKHSSANQQEMFAEAITSGRCTNGSCYDKKTQEHLEGLKSQLTEDFPVVRIINVGENNTLTVLKSEGVDGVGVEQAALCKACAKYGAAVSNIPGKLGTVYRNVCFDVACNTQKVAANIKATKAASTPKESTQTVAKKQAGASTSTATASAAQPAKKQASVQDSQRVIDYRIKVWRTAIKKQLLVDANNNLSMLISVLMTVGGSNVSSTKLAAAFQKLAGAEVSHGDVKGAAMAMASASDEVRQKMLSGVVVSIMDSIESRHLAGIMAFLQVDLTRHWKLNEEYLNLLTKSEIEVVAAELGLKDAMGDQYSKAASGKKDAFVKSLLNVDGFDYTGKVVSVLQYQQ